jgi:hypothetical protein
LQVVDGVLKAIPWGGSDDPGTGVFAFGGFAAEIFAFGPLAVGVFAFGPGAVSLAYVLNSR